MLRRTIFPLVLILAAVTLVPAAQAHWFSGLGRHLGVGWSDGYHAKNACPPQQAGGYPNGSAETPWWVVPGPQEEILPHPPASSAARTHRPAGPSLLRQPGEGSRVIVTETPAGSP